MSNPLLIEARVKAVLENETFKRVCQSHGMGLFEPIDTVKSIITAALVAGDVVPTRFSDTEPSTHPSECGDYAVVVMRGYPRWLVDTWIAEEGNEHWLDYDGEVIAWYPLPPVPTF